MHCIIAPPRVRVWSKNGWHVYFDPYNFVWVKVAATMLCVKFVTVSVAASELNL